MLEYEAANVEAYTLLLRIEVGLRELLRKTLTEQLGPGWGKRLPGDLLTKVREAQRDEESKRQFDFVRLGPLYYLTLGELAIVLRQATAREALACLGGAAFVAQLENLLPVRNAI